MIIAKPSPFGSGLTIRLGCKHIWISELFSMSGWGAHRCTLCWGRIKVKLAPRYAAGAPCDGFDRVYFPYDDAEIGPPGIVDEEGRCL
jgi:hypothetical protein